MIEWILGGLFVLSASTLVHTYVAYPLSLFLGQFVGSESASRSGDRPSVALIIAAYNEEEVIGEKIENSLKLDYPADELSIVVFSDASSDRTDEIVREYADRGVELVRIEGRVGKTACQNEVATQVDADVLVFSDADSMYEPDAITNLVERFGPTVGCVVGELRYRQSSEVEGESVYWRYESAIKRLESRVHSLVTGNGAIYAVRAESYVPLPRDAISDFAEPLEIVRNGELVKYAPDAVAWEETDASTASEFARRVRIVTRTWNSVVEYPDLLNPVRRPLFAYQLWSHKVLRWLSPVSLGLLFVATVGLVLATDTVLVQLCLGGQVLCYLLAGVGALADRLGVDDPLVTHVPYYFVRSNYGLFLGLWRFLRGTNVVVWETSSRNVTQEER